MIEGLNRIEGNVICPSINQGLDKVEIEGLQWTEGNIDAFIAEYLKWNRTIKEEK